MGVLKVLLNTVHFILSTYNLLLCLCQRLKNFLLVSNRPKDTPLKTDVKSLAKLPVHVGFVVVENDFSFPDLAKVAVWCVIFGISHISIYDRQGIVKSNKDVFDKEFQACRKKLSSCSDMEESSVYIQSGNKKQSSDAESLSRKSVYIRLLSMEDGRQHLVELTKHLSQTVSSQNLKLSDIQPVTVDNILKDIVGVPDPDMVVRFGQTESLMGFLPWQIRLTEFLSLRSHKYIDYSSFYQVFQSYASTKQRFGK